MDLGALSRLPGKSGRKLLAEGAGPLILATTLLGWVLLLWIGWVLIFLMGDRAVINSTTNASANFWDRIYYGGMMLSTLGVDDFVAGTSFWRILSAIGSLSGLVLITSAITYIVSVLSAVIGKRQLAAVITARGQDPYALLIRHWNGHSFELLQQAMPDLAAAIMRYAHQQLAYPVLNYFLGTSPPWQYRQPSPALTKH